MSSASRGRLARPRSPHFTPSHPHPPKPREAEETWRASPAPLPALRMSHFLSPEWNVGLVTSASRLQDTE